MQSKWPLNVPHFSWLDRLKISAFFLNPRNRWTQDEQVKMFEREMAAFVGTKYSVFTSSGSTANTLLAMHTRDTGDKNRNIVVLPAVTWQTSCSPWIREGFTPHFIDVDLKDLSIDCWKLEAFLEKNHEKVACIFVTSLLGFSPNLSRLAAISQFYNVKVMMDNCENTLGGTILPEDNYVNVSRLFTSTTSTYFGHQIQSVEGGFIFTNDEEEYHYFLMNRNHGMTRSLKVYGIEKNIIDKYTNWDVDAQFDFYSLGNNFRNSDINAFIGRLDLKRAPEYAEKRKELYDVFYNSLSSAKYFLPLPHEEGSVPFCLPIIGRDVATYRSARAKCIEEGIETRPIISGNLLRQTVYKQFGNPKDYPNAEFLHQNGFYIGLYPKLKKKDIIKLVEKLNVV